MSWAARCGAAAAAGKAHRCQSVLRLHRRPRTSIALTATSWLGPLSSCGQAGHSR
jgi:hypothetical protein